MLNLERTKAYGTPEVFKALMGGGGFEVLKGILYVNFTKNGRTIPKSISKDNSVTVYSASSMSLRSGDYKCRRRTSGQELAIFSKEYKLLTIITDELVYRSESRIDSRPSYLKFTSVVEVFNVSGDEVNDMNYHLHFNQLEPDRSQMTFSTCEGKFHFPDKSVISYKVIDEICHKAGLRIRPFRETMDYPLFYSDEDHFMFLTVFQNYLEQS